MHAPAGPSEGVLPAPQPRSGSGLQSGGTEVLLFRLPSPVAPGNFGSSKELGNESGESSTWGPTREMIRVLGTAKGVLITLGPSPKDTFLGAELVTGPSPSGAGLGWSLGVCGCPTSVLTVLGVLFV